jgi:hypothetical protein
VDNRRGFAGRPGGGVREFLEEIIGAAEGCAIGLVVRESDDPRWLGLATSQRRSAGARLAVSVSVTEESGLPTLLNRAEDLAQRARTDVPDCSLVLDLGSFSNPPNPLQVISVGARLSNWREVIVSGGSFPRYLSDEWNAPGTYRRPRHEWLFWRKLEAALAATATPHFSDYLVFSGSDAPMENHAGSISLRYSQDDEFMVYKGMLSEQSPAGHAQFVGHAGLLCGSPEFFGSRFSSGDEFIWERRVLPGNPLAPELWRAASINHHATLVLAQLASASRSSLIARRAAQSDSRAHTPIWHRAPIRRLPTR